MAKPTLSIKGFIKFLENSNADTRFEYWCNNCAWGQYLTSLGFTDVYVGVEWWSVGRRSKEIPYRLSQILLRHDSGTFGSLLRAIKEDGHA